MMALILSRYWWLLVLRGVAAIVFGIAALVWPGLTLLVLIYLFGAYALIDGVLSLGLGIDHLIHRQSHAWAPLLQGLAGIIAGLIAFAFPGLTALALVFLIAAWAIVIGVFEFAAAIRLRDEIEGEWALGLAGLVSIIFGLALIGYPRTGALAIIWTIGLFSIVAGVMIVILGIRVRGLGRVVTRGARRPHPAL